MLYRIVNETKGVTIVSLAKIASNFFSRLLGLMFKKKIKKDEALIFYQAPSIHTFFMRFPIDIVFLDKTMKVKRIVNCLRPGKAVICKGAYVTIEFFSGKIKDENISLGDQIKILPQS